MRSRTDGISKRRATNIAWIAATVAIDAARGAGASRGATADIESVAGAARGASARAAFAKQATRIGLALPAAGGDAQVVLQVPEALASEAYGTADFAFGDCVADADVHIAPDSICEQGCK
jgi:hypothetical protein